MFPFRSEAVRADSAGSLRHFSFCTPFPLSTPVSVRRRFRVVSDSQYQSTPDAVYVYVVPWSEYPSIPSNPQHSHDARYEGNVVLEEGGGSEVGGGGG